MGSYSRPGQVRAQLTMSSYRYGGAAIIPAESLAGSALVEGQGYDRGHLLAKALGGRGDTRLNLTPLSGPSNQNMNHYAEGQMRNQFKRGEPTFSPNNVIRYVVTPVYSGPEALERRLKEIVPDAPDSAASRLFIAAQTNQVTAANFQYALAGRPLTQVEYQALREALKRAFLAKSLQIDAQVLRGTAVVGGHYSVDNHM
jgi:hypothetical protein